jgi:hypothetical protein
MNTRKTWLRNTLVAAVGVLAFYPFRKRSEKPASSKVRMLTQDGELVEIDRDRLPSSSGKISNKDLQRWIKRP